MHDAGQMSVADAIAWVVDRGVAPSGRLTGRPLTGGVSSTVIAVEGDAAGVVVKRARQRLAVKVEWLADITRSRTEGSALTVFASITPDHVPAIIDSEPATGTLALERAPIDARDWRSVILDGEVDSAIGAEIGAVVGAWHRATWMPWSGADDFTDGASALEQLRLQPFHAAVARLEPRLAPRILACAAQLRAARICLVHGDLSPKNILVLPDAAPWILDPEVAHIGDPVFDVAFLCAHLLLAAVARPHLSAAVRETWDRFLQQYLAVAPAYRMADRLSAHVGCLVLARTDGISREPGLDHARTTLARELGRRLLDADAPIDAIWDRVDHGS